MLSQAEYKAQKVEGIKVGFPYEPMHIFYNGYHGEATYCTVEGFYTCKAKSPYDPIPDTYGKALWEVEEAFQAAVDKWLEENPDD